MSSLLDDRPCIYCATRPAAPGEHLFPAALGRFPISGTEKALLCKKSADDSGCNEKLTGSLYDALFRHGPYSLLRRCLPHAVGRTARGKGRSRGPRYEAPTAPIPGTNVQAALDVAQGGVHGSYATQIIFELPSGSLQHWVVPPSVESAAQLREAVYRAGFRGAKFARFIDNEAGSLERLLREAWPHLTMERAGTTARGTRVESVLRKEISAIDRRAIAMLAFHLYLCVSSARGDEPGFARLRRVIMGESDSGSLVKDLPGAGEGALLVNLCDAIPSQPKHLFVIHPGDDGQLSMGIRLFAQADSKAPWWHVRLAKGIKFRPGVAVFALGYFTDGPRTLEGRTLDGDFLRVDTVDDHLVVSAPK